MNMVPLFLKRAAGFGPLPEILIEAECSRDLDKVLTASFPPLSRLERERQAIARKRDRLTDDRECVVAERDQLLARIAELDAEEADINLILAGLEKHEFEIAEYDPADDAKRSYDLAVQVKRERGDTTWPTRASEEAKPTKPKRGAGKALVAVEA